MLKATASSQVQSLRNHFNSYQLFASKAHVWVFVLAVAGMISVCHMTAQGQNKVDGGYDGPAQLPIATVQSAMSQTPAHWLRASSIRSGNL